MNRTPPAAVLRELRREVGYGCPVPGCRNALLTWHHFDPPWHVREHHDSAGMIGLCRQHHDAADAGVYSTGELRDFKNSRHALAAASVEFPWAKREFLVRLGGCYSGGMAVHLALGGQPAVRFSRSDEGLLLISFVLRSPDGAIVAEVDENMLVVHPEALHDLELSASAARVRAWLAKRDIGLDLVFARLTVDQLREQLARDRTDTAAALPVADDLRPLLADARLPDIVGDFVTAWAREHCLDDDGRISLIDFRQLVLYGNGRHVVVRDGICSGGAILRYSASFDSAEGAFNL